MLEGKRTKAVSILMVLMAVIKTVIDVIDGSGFNISTHYDDIILALNGAGFYFLRAAVK